MHLLLGELDGLACSVGEDLRLQVLHVEVLGTSLQDGFLDYLGNHLQRGRTILRRLHHFLKEFLGKFLLLVCCAFLGCTFLAHFLVL